MSGETLTTIVAIFLAAILIGIFPMMAIADRNDDISQLTVQTATAQFVDNVIKTGKITQEEYQAYLLRMGSSGNTYEVDMEIMILDENPSKRYTNSTGDLGENAYYSIYSTQIEDKLQKDERVTGVGQLILKEGDRISVVAKNSSKTLSQTLKNIYYTISKEEMHIISASASGTIAINGAT